MYKCNTIYLVGSYLGTHIVPTLELEMLKWTRHSDRGPMLLILKYFRQKSVEKLALFSQVTATLCKTWILVLKKNNFFLLKLSKIAQ
jgi:hypothetical protein